MAITLYFLLLLMFQDSALTEPTSSGSGPEAEGKKMKAGKIGKSVMDMTEADMYKLLDQWDENDEDHDPNDLDDDDPRREQAKTPLNFDPKLMKEDPMSLLKMSKKGKPLMMFANVAGNPSRRDTERITGLWQTSLHNAQLQVQRYVIADNRVLFHLQDGSKAWEIKDYLITLKDCEEVQFENQKFPGAGAKTGAKPKTEL